MRLETERLVLRRWLPDDVDPLAAILLHPDVVAWIGPAGANRDDVARAIERYDRHWEAHGFGRLAVVDRTHQFSHGRHEIWVRVDGVDQMIYATSDLTRFGQVYRALQRAIENG